MTHLLKAEAELAKHEVVEAYVVYGLNVFEYVQGVLGYAAK